MKKQIESKVKRKICVITGTRSEYGLQKPILKEITNHPKLELQLLVTGMHLSKDHGYSVKEIENDGFKISAKIEAMPKNDTSKEMAKSIARWIFEMCDVFEKLKPDIVLVPGDRAEALAGAIAAAYMNIPVAHTHGGDRTMGGLDESARHAISKFAHIHFPATKKSAERIMKLGEDKWRINTTGSCALDEILKVKLYSKKELEKALNIKLEEKFFVLVQHPVSTEPELSSFQMIQTIEAIKLLGIQTIIIYPNSDSGGAEIIKVIKKYSDLPFIKTYKNLNHTEYLSLLKYASVLIGNSSSAMTESSSFKLPCINIGIRQQGRERADNVIDVNHNTKEIIAAIQKAMSKEFIRNMRMPNPYGDGRAAERISEILATIPIDKKLLQKQNSY